MPDVRLNIHDAKTHLSRYLNEMSGEDRIVVCRRNRPIAEIRLLKQDEAGAPRLGVAKGEFELTDGFFEPLPEDLLSAFRGGS